MSLNTWLKNKINNLTHPKDDEQLSAVDLINFKIVVVEFSDNVEGHSGETITQHLCLPWL